MSAEKEEEKKKTSLMECPVCGLKHSIPRIGLGGNILLPYMINYHQNVGCEAVIEIHVREKKYN